MHCPLFLCSESHGVFRNKTGVLKDKDGVFDVFNQQDDIMKSWPNSAAPRASSSTTTKRTGISNDRHQLSTPYIRHPYPSHPSLISNLLYNKQLACEGHYDLLKSEGCEG